MARDTRYDRFLGVQFDTYEDALTAFYLVFNRPYDEDDNNMIRSRVRPAPHEEREAHLAISIDNLSETVDNLSARICELEADLKGIGNAAAGNGAGGSALGHLKAQQAAHERNIRILIRNELDEHNASADNGPFINSQDVISQADIENLTIKTDSFEIRDADGAMFRITSKGNKVETTLKKVEVGISIKLKN